MQDIHTVLRQYWSFDQFRPLQETIIRSVLEGRDTLALLPTGGGKSICFQVPALAKEGICIVISPLIALMQDQVENLKRRGIPAIAITSGMHKREIDIALDNCVYGNVKFLYVSPERLQTEIFQVRVKKMNVNLIAVDEAHCISQWGYDFRPPYRQIAELRELLPGIPVLALTATATLRVVEDIQEQLHFAKPNVLRKSFARPNLAYIVRHEEDKAGRLLRICNSVPGSGVVYVRNRKKTREIAEFLMRNGIVATWYHAGLDAKLRIQRQREWIEDKTRIIVATNAFGMGIDKPDVRFVVHLDLPEAPEAYFQEAGRAGRDEKSAFAVLLWNDRDLLELEHHLERSFPSIDEIRQTYQALANRLELPVGAGQGQTFVLDLHELCETYKLDPHIAFGSLRALEREGWLVLSDALYQPSRLMVTAHKDELYEFQVVHRNYDEFIKLLLRSLPGLFEQYVKVSESQIGKRAKLSTDEVVKRLNELQQKGLVSYLPQTDRPLLTFLLPRADAKHLSVSPEHLADRKKEAEARAKSMTHYVKSIRLCRTRILLEYFGEEPKEDCGVCDVCRDRNKKKMSMREEEVLHKHLEELLATQSLDIRDVVSASGTWEEEDVIRAVRWLLDNDYLSVNGEGKLEKPKRRK